LLQAQQTLIELGYEPGSADGVYGPRTRQALEAFQRAHNLPATGVLDTPTQQALDRAGYPTSAATSESATTLPTTSPLHVVVDYLRFRMVQPARTLPYVTEEFRQGASPQEWLTQIEQESQGETYVGWKIQRLNVAETQAIAYVQTRWQAQGQEHTRSEVFTLVRTPEGEWLIDGWRLEKLAADQQSTRPRF
jgi:peptidoglycan hydrolase-like protein with peptidoglycan-binding domain